MKQLQEPATDNNFEEAKQPLETTQDVRTSSSWLVQYKWWIQMALFTTFVLAGQSVATMLGRLYFDKGGNSKWMATLVQTADCLLYTFGLKYLPVSTYSLICASQLAFNALFSYFLNGQKITPYIANSLVLLSFSSSLLVFQSDSEDSVKTSRSKYIIGFVCTVAASAGYALMLSVTQLAFQKILKSESYRVVFDMIVYQNMIASVIILVGLFASGEWKDIKNEMKNYESGTISYIMNLVWTAISWQVFSIGCVGLIFEVSSLFSNVISTLGIPIVPVFAVVFFHDKMNGVKVISMLLAIWGFTSYIYQHYLDDLQEKQRIENVNPEVDLTTIRNS
ncbi:probable purine permease 10 isoform X3 [Rutidosis leptorrhynchoides]|uniref:probable purine permease 10 isoform X3 n=1 Tax=Rutidosis leptorrhynchoides TaxID=125765 RepID=UPI003A98F1CC